MLYEHSKRVKRQKALPRSSLGDIGQDPRRVLDLAHGERIHQLWDSETDRARGLGVFGSLTFAVESDCSGVTTASKTL
jgi:2-hydroxychromene-2-carboxylate isomerase